MADTSTKQKRPDSQRRPRPTIWYKGAKMGSEFIDETFFPPKR